MKQFILNSEPDRDGRVRLEGRDYRYLVRVRRLAPGEYFPALLPDGTGVMVRVCSVDKQIVVGEIATDVAAPPVSPLPQGGVPPGGMPPIILFQALPKGEKMDLIVRQAAEGGLAEIVPFVSEFSMVKLTGKGSLAGHKLSRWERIIKEARQQSGSTAATAIRQPLSIDGLFAYWERLTVQHATLGGTTPGGTTILGLLFHHLPLAQTSLHGYLDSSPETVALVIGPEGGFSSAEAKRFIAAGFKPFTIGNTILRTETASLYAQAAVRILLGEKNSWKTK